VNVLEPFHAGQVYLWYGAIMTFFKTNKDDSSDMESRGRGKFVAATKPIVTLAKTTDVASLEGPHAPGNLHGSFPWSRLESPSLWYWFLKGSRVDVGQDGEFPTVIRGTRQRRGLPLLQLCDAPGLQDHVQRRANHT
jgi:hypothetical protein